MVGVESIKKICQHLLKDDEEIEAPEDETYPLYLCTKKERERDVCKRVVEKEERERERKREEGNEHSYYIFFLELPPP